MNNLQIIKQEVENYKVLLKKMNGRADRADQADDILESLTKSFNVNGPLNIIETGASQQWHDGMMGVLFARIAKRTGGQMWVVDIDPTTIAKSKEAFKELDLDFVQFYTGDSVEFLQNFNDRVDLIHLDSWNLNLLDPFPSALHGWREFEAIKDKVNSGCVIMVDDNFLKGSWVNWDSISNGNIIKTNRIDITHPCIGKGAHIYWWAQQSNNDWNLIPFNNFKPGRNVKIICQKN